MQLTLILALMVGQAWSQQPTELNATILDLINQVYSTTPPTTTTCEPGTLCIPGLRRVTFSNTESYGEKCGEGSMRGKWMCIRYDLCDPKTDTIVKIRRSIKRPLGINFAKCNDSLERCCQIPEGGFPVDPNPNGGGTTPPPSSIAAPTRASFASSRCGIRNEDGIGFTIKGNNNTLAEFGEFPWMVALIKKNSNPSAEKGFSFCGGSLINQNVVLTAAHCVFRSTPGEIKVRVGEWNAKSTTERFPYQERNVANIIIDKDYSGESILNDVALLVLKRAIDKDEHISTICLPDQGQVIESRNCFVSSWGQTVEEAYVGVLKKIDLPIVPGAQCQEALTKTPANPYFVLHDSLLCVGGEEGKDACTSNGGSPLVCPDPNNPRRYLLAGIVAGGINCGESNVKGNKGMYAKVSRFRSWIDEEMRKLNFNTNLYIS